MKRRMHVITVFFGIALGMFLYDAISNRFPSFKDGFIEGYNSDSVEKHYESCYLTLDPENFSAMPDSIFNKKTGKWIPARMMEVYVRIPMKENPNGLRLLWLLPCVILLFAGFLMVVYNFVLMTIAVGKSIVFEWINVRRIRRIGIGFSILFVVASGINIYFNRLALDLIEIENYKIITSSFASNLLMFGAIAFLIAEVFAVGLRLKEEQDLTI
ncbi:MAG: DUF2975 domain-containing protein [Tannerella sp.]|jgi:hypothetical protein|nr:DUF2975 domain-containing protein [Tannerella sp.]